MKQRLSPLFFSAILLAVWAPGLFAQDNVDSLYLQLYGGNARGCPSLESNLRFGLDHESDDWTVAADYRSETVNQGADEQQQTVCGTLVSTSIEVERRFDTGWSGWDALAEFGYDRREVAADYWMAGIPGTERYGIDQSQIVGTDTAVLGLSHARGSHIFDFGANLIGAKFAGKENKGDYIASLTWHRLLPCRAA